MMNYKELIVRICADGIEAAQKDYSQPKDKEKLKGAQQGFNEAAATQSPHQLAQLLAASGKECQEALLKQDENYWFVRCRHLEIEWAANVVSAALMNEGLPVIINPTVRGVMKAAEILGVAA
jgi:hypothetical protein